MHKNKSTKILRKCKEKEIQKFNRIEKYRESKYKDHKTEKVNKNYNSASLASG